MTVQTALNVASALAVPGYELNRHTPMSRLDP
jgi:hypothetical protein